MSCDTPNVNSPNRKSGDFMPALPDQRNLFSDDDKKLFVSH